jgi:hypothetical protein
MKFEDMSVRATKALLRAGVSSIEQAAIAEEITDATISVIHRRREGFRKENPDDSV